MIEISKKAGNYRIIDHYFDFKEENPEWEPVELIAQKNTLLISWKSSDDKKNSFRYIKHNYEGKALEETNAAYFRDSYNLITVDDANFAVKGFSLFFKNNDKKLFFRGKGRFVSQAFKLFPGEFS